MVEELSRCSRPRRRDVLRSVPAGAAAIGLSGCLGIFGDSETERDVDLQRSNWLTPESNDPEIASGYNDIAAISDSVQSMDGVSWEDFANWVSVPAADMHDSARYPWIPEEALEGATPFDIEGPDDPFDSRNVPAMATLTVDTGDSITEQSHLGVYQLPDAVSKDDMRQHLTNNGYNFKQIETVSVSDSLVTGDSGVRSTFALEDGVVIQKMGASVSDGSDTQLHRALERAGTDADIGDHPVGTLGEMDMVASYGEPFLERGGQNQVSKSAGIDLENEGKTVVYTFTDEEAAQQGRELFSLRSGGNVVYASEDEVIEFGQQDLEYHTIRVDGRGLVFEADIETLPGAITEGRRIWSYGLGTTSPE